MSKEKTIYKSIMAIIMLYIFLPVGDASTDNSHTTHLVADRGPKIDCSGCHGSQSPPLFADGKTLENTTVCDTCHSPDGAYDGVDGPDIGARNNWDGVYDIDNTLKAGKEMWCIGCHDDSPAVVNGETAANKAGDSSNYGYYETGHGRKTDYSRMSWQDIAAPGNPGANRTCIDCHDGSLDHIVNGLNPQGSRLKAGYENNHDNTICNNCHEPGGIAVSDPQFYTTSSRYEGSVHGNNKCTECHDVHGTAGPYPAMTKNDKESLCFNCHTSHEGHALGVSFGKDGKIYSLECTSCHNVHVITGMHTIENKSPLSLFSNNIEVWGDEPGEKMDDYAGSGTYRTPKGDSLSGSQLPDYVTFCLDCHGVSQSEFGPHGGISWGTDEPHGLNSANQPNGYGTCPNWYACGKAEGWDGDLCIGDESTCWPVLPRGRGDQLFSRLSYNHEERIAGANFVLSCSDCHVTHESGVGSKLRSLVNNGPGSTIWNTMCNNCHYYYSDWHAGMSCGSASCHVSGRMSNTGTNTIHDMSSRTGSGGTRTFNPDLVADMRFDNNLKDSGSFLMDGRWYGQYAGGGAGSFVSGKFGTAIQVDGNQPIELGTENDRWSTDAGYHGTWVYSEMKNTMTLEAWVYPTDNQAGGENHIISKHTYTNGGYALLLKNIEGSLRAALLANVNGGEVVWNTADCNGLRGAYSTVPVPLNQWTHIAAVFDSNLQDRDPDDLSVGRIRIYVNGEDVTTSYSDVSQCYAQPGAGENDIFSYNEMNIKNESRCYAGHWCASALSIGGLMWGDGSRKGLIGRIDNAKVWNIAKDSIYFDNADQASPPRIAKAEGTVDSDQVVVTFSEGVWANMGQSGSLQSGDFTLTDPGSRAIQSVTHSAGSSTATLTLSSPLVYGIQSEITLAAGSIFDEYDNSAVTNPVTITCDDCLIISTAYFLFNEPAGSTTITDELAQLTGAVNDPSGTLTGDGYFNGDGVDNYIDFENNPQDFKVSTSMTLEARIKPTGLGGTDNYIKRIFARDQGGNYQMSVWRNNGWTNYNAPSGTASIALWTKVVDAHGGTAWKPVLTDYDACPIVSDHWYKVRAVWNSGKTGGIPGDIFVDDQGIDGNGAGEIWSGYSNCTDSDQSQLTSDRYLVEGDQILTSDGDFTIGANVNNHANNVFNGLIDWIMWKDEVDYSVQPPTPIEDIDSDGIAYNADNCPSVSNADQADADSDGTGDACDTDDDNDGVPDSEDAFPLDNTESVDTDGNGIGNNADTDDDGDGVGDVSDAFPLDASESVDTDGDGVGNNADTDDDNDGVPDPADAFPLDASESVDTDGDGVGNNADNDDDNDGVPDPGDAFPLDASESVDTDGDGVGNNADNDDDNDGVPDLADAFPLDASESVDTDGDGIGNNADNDDDGDGVLDDADNCPSVANADQADIDGDGTGDACDTDDDGDSVLDDTDNCPSVANQDQADTDDDGTGDACEPDSEDPITSDVLVSPNPAAINTAINLNAIVSDATTGDSRIWSAEYSIDNNGFDTMAASDGHFDSASEEVTANLGQFINPGVHNICVRATDAAGNTGAQECTLLAVYDPTGGFVTGGGWINSPGGAYLADPGLTGKANFGFVSKYKKGATIPTGETEFQFKLANLNFHSSSYEWLVVAGARAQYKGTGTINGEGNYGFMLTAFDAEVNSNDGFPKDMFRIKIWDKDNGDVAVYDNKQGSSDTGNEATELGGGSIVIHEK